MSYVKMWLYGEPFSGKTKFATEFPNPIILSTDGNASKYLPKERIFIVKDADEFGSTLDKVINDKLDIEYDTVIIDVVEQVYDYLRTYYLNKLGIDYEGDVGFGKTWKMIEEGMWELFKPLAHLDKNVILISHEEMIVKKTNFGLESNEYRPLLRDKLHTRFTSIMQLVGRVYTEDVDAGVKKHYVSFGHNGNEMSGVRIELFDTLIPNDYESFIANIKEDK